MKVAEANRVTSFLCNSCIEMLKVIYPLVQEDLDEGLADNLQMYDRLGHNVERTLNFADLVLSEVARDEVDELTAAAAKDVSENIRATNQKIINNIWEFRTRAMGIDGVSWGDEADTIIYALLEEEDYQSHLDAIRTGEGSLLKIVEEIDR